MQRPYLWAAIAGIAVLVIGAIGVAISFSLILRDVIGGATLGDVFSSSITPLLYVGILSSLVNILFYYGFVVLGKQYKDKFLASMGWLWVAAMVLLIASNGHGLTTDYTVPSIEGLGEGSFLDQIKTGTQSSPGGSLLFIFGEGGFWVMYALLILGTLAINVLLGLALIRLKEVKLAVWAGWFQVAAAIIGVCALVAAILEIIIFFQEDKKSREKKAPQRTPKASLV